jgi:hypothetical protein
MDEPEQPDQAASPAMRRVFEEFEAEFDAGLRLEAEQETVAALRAEIGETVLWEQLARRAGTQAVAHAGSRRFRGVIIASYPEFLVLHDGDGTEHLIRYGPATSVALPAETATLQPTPAAAARRREPVRVELVDGGRVDGTIEAVGSNYLEIAEHDLGEARRRRAVKARGSWAWPRSRRSAFLRRADERVLAGPFGRLLVHPLDVGLELVAVHPPHAPPAQLDGGQLAAADQRIDLRHPHVEDRGHVLERVEPRFDAGSGHATS